jgi:hypothetical protein
MSRTQTKDSTMNCHKCALLISCFVAVCLAVPGRAASGTNAVAEASSAASASLPVTEISLYSSGVGFFERDGQVEGRARVDLRFKTDDINDLLKSMVVRDSQSGRVASVTYGSRDPLTRTLRSFGIDLTENPTLGQLLNQARGEQVTLQWPTPLTGTILGVEKKKQPVGENKDMDVEYLNLVTDDGLQSIPLAQVQKVRLLNDRLDAELHQALTLLAASHDKDKKTVSIAFDGEGKREVTVSYVVQTPVWKTSYRLVVDDKAAPFLQGWAIVENTSDEDWTNVRLALVSGRPISFVMDLYEPLFASRPVVQPELFRFLRPQVYQDVMEAAMAAPVMPAPAGRGGRGAAGGGGGGGFGGGGGGGRTAGAAPAQQFAMASPVSAAMEYASEGAMNRMMDLQAGVASAAITAQTGELFTYQIKTPVTLARQRSAMLPIVNQNIAGDKVSIYNESTQAKFPLNGIRLTNTTALHLMQGPITVFEAGAYAGDARIEDLAPGADRLLSYGLDLATEVDPQSGARPVDLLTVVVHKGVIIATRKYSEEKTYNIRSHDLKKKTLIIEHPYRADWTIVEPKEKPERTRDAYRFILPVEAGAQTKLVIREERQVNESATLLNTANEGLQVYLRSQKISAAVKDALQKVAAMRNTLSQTASDRARREQRISEITQEQARIRENMARLNQTSDLFNSYVKELTQQETDLASLRKEIETLKDTETKQQRDLNDYILNLDVE